MLARMAEITDIPFRRICREYGASLVFTQMISVKEYVNNSFETLQKTFFEEEERPISIQLLGKDEEMFEKCVLELNSLNPDSININLGCPSKNVLKYGLGGELLKDKKKIFNIIKKIKKNVDPGILISAKIRLGLSHSNFLAGDIAEVCQEAGLDFLILHFRFVNENYSVPARWEFIDEIRKKTSLPIVGNGSIFSAEDALKIFKIYDVDALMIARGAIGNPLIFYEIQKLLEVEKISEEELNFEKFNQIIRHLNFSKMFYGDYQGAINFRKHFLWYFKYHPNFEEIKKYTYEIIRCDDFENLAERYKQGLLNINSKIKTEIDKKFMERILFWLK